MDTDALPRCSSPSIAAALSWDEPEPDPDVIVIDSDDDGEVWYRKRIRIAPSDDLFDPTDTGEDPEVHNE